MFVEPQYPVPHDLDRHAPDSRCLSLVSALVDRGQCQKTAGLRSTLVALGFVSDRSGIEIWSEWVWHGELPSVHYPESHARYFGNPFPRPVFRDLVQAYVDNR